jgi:hypothetical protein
LVSKDLASASLCLLQSFGQKLPTLEEGLLVMDGEAQGRENFVRFRFVASVWHGAFSFQALPVELPNFISGSRRISTDLFQVEHPSLKRAYLGP